MKDDLVFISAVEYSRLSDLPFIPGTSMPFVVCIGDPSEPGGYIFEQHVPQLRALGERARKFRADVLKIESGANAEREKVQAQRWADAEKAAKSRREREARQKEQFAAATGTRAV